MQHKLLANDAVERTYILVLDEGDETPSDLRRKHRPDLGIALIDLDKASEASQAI